MDIRIREEYLKKAVELHKNNYVADAHLDLAGEILLRREAGEEEIIKRHYLTHLKQAGIRLVVSSVYIPGKIVAEGAAAAWENAVSQIEALKEETKELKAEAVFAASGAELMAAEESGKIAFMIYMEGLECIGEDMGRLRELKAMGVSGASLTWSRNNPLANGCCKAREEIQITGGLTQAGRKAVKEMERLSLFLDISHLNDDGFSDVCRIAEKPFIATHSCAKAVYKSYRNLTDEQMEELAKRGGVMGINGCQYIAGSEKGNHLEMLCRHAEYETEKIGAEHVGFGFDLCDSYDEAEAALTGKDPGKKIDCFYSHGQIPLLTAALLQRGMKEEEVKQLMGKSFREYFIKNM